MIPPNMTIATLITIEEIAQIRAAWRRNGETLAFVPTMGALHDGHMSLVRQARTLADRVLVSIFVNPTQFGPNEDFDRYPRTVAADVELLQQGAVDAVFLPNVATIYPEGHQTSVRNKRLESQLCGAFRPGHFEGVLTVVAKLFNIVQPDFAVFGKKDYQQFRLIEAMVRDLNMPVKIVGSETAREADGLAMSSRNRYLSDELRKESALIHRGMQLAKSAFQKGQRDPAQLIALCKGEIAKSLLAQIEYVELRTQNELEPWTGDQNAKEKSGAQTEIDPVVMLVAARFGSTRLIDNLEF